MEVPPALVESVIRHADEAVALVAAPNRELVERAVQAITVETEPRPAALDIDESLAADVVVHAPDNVFKRIEILKGGAAQAIAAADIVVEGRYEVGSQEHVYIEPQGVQAEWSDDGVMIQGSLQCPYYVHKALVRLLGVAPERGIGANGGERGLTRHRHQLHVAGQAECLQQPDQPPAGIRLPGLDTEVGGIRESTAVALPAIAECDTAWRTR